MSETTGGKRSIEELEAAVLRSLDRYFEACRGEVEDSKGRAGAGFKKYEEAQRQLADAEQELEELRHRTAALKAEALDAVTGGSEASELKEGISELQEEADVLAKAEEAEERLWLAQQNFDGDLGKAADGVAAIALREAEEIDAFNGRLDQRFAEGRIYVIEAAT